MWIWYKHGIQWKDKISSWEVSQTETKMMIHSTKHYDDNNDDTCEKRLRLLNWFESRIVYWFATQWISRKFYILWLRWANVRFQLKGNSNYKLIARLASYWKFQEIQSTITEHLLISDVIFLTLLQPRFTFSFIHGFHSHFRDEIMMTLFSFERQMKEVYFCELQMNRTILIWINDDISSTNEDFSETEKIMRWWIDCGEYDGWKNFTQYCGWSLRIFAKIRRWKFGFWFNRNYVIIKWNKFNFLSTAFAVSWIPFH